MPELSQLAPGTMLGDRYRIDELISIGGMGAVYAASHMFLNRRMAIKVLRNDLPGAEMMADRFRREAIAASAIGHENIVRVTDMGMSPENTPYLVMELLEGSDLADALDSAPFAVSRSSEIICAVLRGLGAAHRAGIVHRDLKPENIFLARVGDREVIKILDFGVSLLERPEVPSTRLTSTGVVVGTPRYMSPEQARGDFVLTGAVDIYAAAVVLYEMLTNELPYHGSNYNVIIHQIIAGDWVPLDARRAGLPAELVAAVDRAMALDPSERFSSADEMADAIEPFIDFTESVPTVVKTPRNPSRETADTVGPGVARLSEKTPMDDDPAWTSTAPGEGRGPQLTVDPDFDPRSRKKGGHNLVIAAVAAIAVIAAVFVVLGGDDAESPSAAPADAGATDVAALQGATDTAAPVADAAVAPPKQVATDPEPKPDPKPEPRTATPAPKEKKAKKNEKEKERPADKPEPRSKTVTLTFLVIPPSTRVIASGGSVSGKRVTARRGATVHVRLEAPGYMAQSLVLKADRDRDVVRQLERAPEKPPEPAKPEPEPAKPEPEPAKAEPAAPDPEPAKESEPPVVPAPEPPG